MLTGNDTTSFPTNDTIENLVIRKRIQDTYVLKLVKACRAVQVLEFNGRTFINESKLNWSELDQRINTIKFVNCKITPSYIKCFDTLMVFNTAHFIFSCSIENIINELKEYNFSNYMLTISTDSGDNSFTLKLK